MELNLLDSVIADSNSFKGLDMLKFPEEMFNIAPAISVTYYGSMTIRNC